MRVWWKLKSSLWMMLEFRCVFHSSDKSFHTTFCWGNTMPCPKKKKNKSHFPTKIKQKSNTYQHFKEFFCIISVSLRAGTDVWMFLSLFHSTVWWWNFGRVSVCTLVFIKDATKISGSSWNKWWNKAIRPGRAEKRESCSVSRSLWWVTCLPLRPVIKQTGSVAASEHHASTFLFLPLSFCSSLPHPLFILHLRPRAS